MVYYLNVSKLFGAEPGQILRRHWGRIALPNRRPPPSPPMSGDPLVLHWVGDFVKNSPTVWGGQAKAHVITVIIDMVRHSRRRAVVAVRCVRVSRGPAAQLRNPDVPPSRGPGSRGPTGSGQTGPRTGGVATPPDHKAGRGGGSAAQPGQRGSGPHRTQTTTGRRPPRLSIPIGSLAPPTIQLLTNPPGGSLLKTSQPLPPPQVYLNLLGNGNVFHWGRRVPDI